MGERRGTKALELWCRRITEGYPGVNVQNMTTSWRDGLAFCAMIHHFRPDLIDFNSLNKDDIYGNNELAFRTAEQHLGIPALLDAEDMASCAVPDRLSILTYLSQFYQTFGGSSPSRLAMNRTTETTDSRIAPVPESPKQKVGSRLGMRRDPCASCGLPVFLAEKLVIARTPYHRTCFRCARCNNQLTPGNYYETEEGQYCCETCPDEVSSSPSMHQKYNEAVIRGGRTTEKDEEDEERDEEEEKDQEKEIEHNYGGSSYQRSLSDEEKTEQKKVLNPNDTYNVVRSTEDSPVRETISQTSQMRLNFMASHLLSERTSQDAPVEVTPPESLDATGKTGKKREEIDEKLISRVDSAFPDDDENDARNKGEDNNDEDEEEEEEEEEEESSCTTSSTASPNLRKFRTTRDKGDFEEKMGTRRREDDVHRREVDGSLIDKRDDEDEDQQLTAISFHDVVNDKFVSVVDREENTKELLGQAAEHREDREKKGLSLVQKRLRMFECQENKEPVIERKRGDKGYVKSIVETTEAKERANESSLDAGDREAASENVSKINGINRENGDTTITDSVVSEKLRSLSIEDSKDIEEINVEISTTVEDESQETELSLTTAKGIDLSVNEDYPEDLNPFNSDEEDNANDGKYITAMDTSRSSKVSTNPFDSEDDEENKEKEIVPPKPAARSNVASKGRQQDVADTFVPTKRRLAAPQINLNPFWSDEEEDHDSDLEGKEGMTAGENVPVPKPRTIKHTPELGTQRGSDLNRGGVYASNSSITSSESATTPGGTYRKKKPAPPPPMAKELFPSDQRTSSPMPKSYNASTGCHGTSPRTTPRTRKTKPAPPPPMATSTPYTVPAGAPISCAESPVIESHETSDNRVNIWEDQKTNKDETNRNRQSLTNITCGDTLSYKSYPDKSVQGKWKRKKGPAPPRPIPHRRKIRVMSMKDVKLELDEIELQQQGLERQGVRLEQLIRDKCESGSRTDDTSLGVDVEELVLELFALVNEKNELFRRQAELMLLRRQQRLEEEHAEVEYQIRCLMCQPEATKTDFDKQREEALIQRLIEIVERRNEIVECLEMDRRREVEEDKSINKHMDLFAARNKNEVSGNNNDSSHSSKTKKGKIKEKIKEKKSKKSSKKDADKDVDETEVKLKRHKRKWF